MCSSGATCLWLRSVLLLEEKGEREENHRPVASSFKSNYHTMVSTTCPRNRQSFYINYRVFKLLLSVFMLSFIFVIVCDLCELKRIWLFISILSMEIQLSRMNAFWCLTQFSAIFQLYHCDQFYWWSTRREPPPLGKQLVNFITCVASRVHLFCNLQRWERTHAVLVIGLYELLDATT